jgi:hypothetical protein
LTRQTKSFFGTVGHTNAASWSSGGSRSDPIKQVVLGREIMMALALRVEVKNVVGSGGISFADGKGGKCIAFAVARIRDGGLCNVMTIGSPESTIKFIVGKEYSWYRRGFVT